MHLEITLCDGRGERCDVALDAPPGASFGDLVTAARHAAGMPAGPAWVGAEQPSATAPAAHVMRDGSIVSTTPGRGGPGPGAVLVVGGPDAGAWARLGAHATIGRGPGNDLWLRDPLVSREHLDVRRAADGVALLDRGSTNGVRVHRRAGYEEHDAAGRRTDRIAADDVVRIGNSLLSFGSAQPTAAVLPASSVVPDRPSPAFGHDDPPTKQHGAAATQHGAGRAPWAAALLPAAAAGVLAWLTHSPAVLLFAVAGPVVMLAGPVGTRVRATVQRVRRARRAPSPLPAGPQAERQPRVPRVSLDPVRLERLVAQTRAGGWDATANPGTTAAVGRWDPAGRVSTGETAVVDLADGHLQLSGRYDTAAAVARWVVCQLAACNPPDRLRIVLLADASTAPRWHWLRWLPHVVRPPAADPAQPGTQLRAGRSAGPVRRPAATLVVVDAPATDVSAMLARPPGQGVGVVVVRAGRTGDPATTTRLVPLDRDPDRAYLRPAAPTADTPTAAVSGHPILLDQVSVDWADAVARHLAAREPSGPARPGPVGVPDVGDVLSNWRQPDDGLAVIIGDGPDGEVVVDLVGDGPHVLVGGTTGSGKSHLLRTVVLGLALQHPPERVAFVLVDYKGGATFADCDDLPHVAGSVTDLDPHLAHRALVLLDAELRRREAMLAAARSPDLAAFRRGGGTLARLVVVVDEFAALAEDAPDLLRAIVATATRGRSLGIHLLLATQRPGAAITPDIRANTNLRIALRVQDAAESREIIDAPDAAALPADPPGQAWLRTGDRMRFVRVGPPTTGSATAEPQRVDAVVLGPWRTTPSARPGGAPHGGTAAQVVRAAAAHQQVAAADVPWPAPLPARLQLPGDAADAGLALPLGRLDVPSRQAQPLLVVDLDVPASWLVVGGPGSGRTTVLRTALHAALLGAPDASVDVHVVEGGDSLVPAGWPAVRSRLGPAAADRVPVLLQRLRRAAEAGSAPRPALLLVDDWDRVLDCCDDIAGAALGDDLASLLRAARGGRLTVLVSGGRTLLSYRHARGFDHRLLLRLTDPADYGLAGVPVAAIPTDRTPGRGVRAADGVEFQVALPAPLPRPPAQPTAGEHRSGTVGTSPPLGGVGVAPLPRLVRLGDLPVTGSLRIGSGDDGAVPLTLVAPALTRWLVTGPPGSGRSTVLRTLLTECVRLGEPCAAIAVDGSPLAELARRLDVPLGQPGSAAAADGTLLLVDDCEAFADSELGAALVARIERDRGCRMVISGEPATFASAFRGLPAVVRRFRRGIALHPAAGVGELFGARLPRTPPNQPAGRGYLLGGCDRIDPARGPIALQVALADELPDELSPRSGNGRRPDAVR